MAVNFGDNFNVGAFKPIDTRLVVDTPTNLSDGTIAYPYKGMLVSVKNDGGFVRTYRLKADVATPFTNWEVLGGGVTSLSALTDVTITAAANGDVLVYDTTVTRWVNRGPFVESVIAGTSGNLVFTFSDNSYISVQISGGALENNNYASENFITDGQSYNQTISILDEVLGAIAPVKASNLTGQALTLSATTLFSAKVPAGLTAAWVPVAGSTITNYIVDGTYVLTSPSPATSFNANQFSNPSSYGTVSHVRNGVSFVSRNLNLGVGTANASDADGTSALNVTSVALYNSIWTKANANISYTQNAADEGTITHAMSSTVAGTTNVTTLNFDPINTAPSFSVPAFADQVSAVVKYLSGVEHYGNGSVISVEFEAASGIFNRCYHPTAVATVVGNAFTSFNLNPVATPNYLDPFTVAPTNATLSVAFSSGALPGQLTVILQKPSGLTSPSSSNYPVITGSARVNTFGITSTNTFENFLDENRRLIAGTSTPFVSNVMLANGEAQVRNGSLVHGFTDSQDVVLQSYAISPKLAVSDQRYDRRFVVGVQSGGSMTFAGFVPTSIAPHGTGNINIYLQLETLGGYYDLGRPFGSNNGTGDGSSLANSKGGQVSISGSTLNYTFGLFSTASNSNQYRMIIVFKNNTNSITSITIN